MKIRITRDSKTWWGGIVFHDKARRYKLVIAAWSWESMGSPDDLWITVEHYL